MGNSYFKFKAFTVHQEDSAMKVCTDSCVFGALLPVLEGKDSRVLDIGTGTGLLSLMYAQKCALAKIDAIEIDHGAYLQALSNINQSPWPHSINLYEADFKTFAPRDPEFEGYDLIFSNPPFFMDDLVSEDAMRNKALHSTDLTFYDLICKAVSLLKAEGILCVIVPYRRREEMKVIAAKNGLFPFKEVLLRQTFKHMPFRAIQFYGSRISDLSPEELIIKMEDQQYSLKFTELLQPYYLYL